MTAGLAERAPAKINLTLRVTGRRPDGWHDLDSLVLFADLGDRLILEPGPDLALRCEGVRAAAVPADGDNLVLRAARHLAERVAGLALGRFVLHKALPVAAGLGGGSADAAAALRLLARRNGLGADDARLIAAARATGADVPACLLSRTARMGGRGHEVTPIEGLGPVPAVLVNPGCAVPTPAVFAALGLAPGTLCAAPDAFEPLRDPTLSDLDRLLAVFDRGDNDLAQPARRLAPVIGEVEAVLAAGGARRVRMTGSGATVVALAATADEAEVLSRHVRRARGDWWVAPTWLGGNAATADGTMA